MVATLVRVLGVRNVGLAEDVVQDALCCALEIWKYHGVPENPSAWLFQTARNRAVDLIRRGRLQAKAAPALLRRLPASVEEDELRDDQLRMMFSCAHPDLPPEGQVAVILKYLCGFSVPEIAQAFLTSSAAIEKRLARARRSMTRGTLELPGSKSMAARLDSVHQALYLLFNEGYHGSHPERSVREDLCSEALRLAMLLTERPATALPSTFALLALMCLHAARLPSRLDDRGALILLEAQDRSRWNRPLIERGFEFLGRSAEGNALTAFHVEAGIAGIHARAPRFGETDWDAIVNLYTMLYRLRPTPIVALNRAIALGRAGRAEEGLRDLERIQKGGRLSRYPFLAAAAGDLHQQAGRPREACRHFLRAKELARNESERQILMRRAEALGQG